MQEGTLPREDGALEAEDVPGATERTVPVYFVGSSTIARFPLAELYPDRPWVNVGAPNETTVQLRERLGDAVFKSPAGFVLYLGSADHNFDPKLSASEIRKRVEDVVASLRLRASGPASMILLQVLPARQQSADEKSALAAINRELADLATAKGLRFVETNRPPLLDQNGDLAESMSTDRHHLNDEGYRVLARWIVEDGGPVGELLR